MPEIPDGDPRSTARFGATLLCALAFATACAIPLSAQSAAQRAQIEAFRDSIGAITDSVSLLAGEKILIGHASRELRDSAMAHLRLGFIGMRLGDLSGKKHYESAASEFQWVVDLQPKWPYGWFGLGLAELGVGDAEFAPIRGLQTALGKDALTRSANDFARSAEVDPGFVRGLVELSNTALRQRINLRLDVALAALRRSARTAAALNPEVQLARARVEREVGSPDSALAAIDSLVAHHPDDATALLEQARVRFKAGRRDGAIPWYRGLASADPAVVALYRADLRFVLPDSALRTFDAAAGASRVELLRRFWDRRDRDELHMPGDRLSEHYRRLDVARHNYRLTSVNRHYDIVERYRPPIADFDDRGVIYIRQGAPDARASLEQPGIPFNESWAYHRAGAPDMLFHFVAREGVADFRLVESVLDILGYANTIRLENTGHIQGTDGPLLPVNRAAISADSAAKLRQRTNDAALSQVTASILRSRMSLSPIYQRMLSSGAGSASGLQAEERALGHRSLRLGTTTDSWERRYAADLSAEVQLLTASRDSVHSEFQVAYALPTEQLADALRASGGTIAPRVLVSIFTLDGTPGAVVDLLGPSARPVNVAGHDYLLGVISVPYPPGKATVRVGLEINRAGVISSRDTIDIPAPAGPALGISDLALGSAKVPLWWLTDRGDTVRVNPVGQFRAGEPIELSFEIEGAMPDSSYKFELVVKKPGGSSPFRWLSKLFGGGRDPFTLTTTRRAVANRVLVQQGITLRDSKPGKYVFQVTVSHKSGPKVTRTQEFTVVR